MRQLLAALAVLGLLTACDGAAPASGSRSSTVGSPSPSSPSSSSPAASPSPAPTATPSPPSDAATPTPAAADPTPEPDPELTDEELAALGVNELGRVVVGEWHVIGDSDGEYRTSRETFRAQLQDLYDRGYRPVTQAEFIAGTFPIPAGTSPVLLTFDDSTRDHLALDETGEPVVDTAVGIIEAFAADKPDWRPTAVFGFNFPDPFGDAGYAPKLRWLVDNGYELSNHSVGHANLGSLSSAGVVANLAENLARLHEVVPDVEVPSLTLPFGARADDPAVELTGTADGTTYLHELVYLVGAHPSRSPHDVAFDPTAVQRVPAHAVVGTGPEWWGDRLDALDAGGQRFVADGDPDTVTYPDDLADRVAVGDPALRERSYPAAEVRGSGTDDT